MGKSYAQIYHQKDIQMANKPKKETSYVVREQRMKMTVRTTTRRLKWCNGKTLTTPNADKDVEQ